MWATQYSNELVAEISMMKGGDFEGIFSFTHDALCKLLSESYDNYDIRVIDPETDARDREILNGGFELPAYDNRLAHWKVMHDHVCRYLELYYGSDQDLRDDAAIQAWVKDLNRYVPGGVEGLLGDKITIAGAARLITSYIYAGSVEHEVLGSGLWDYQLLVNYNFSVNVRRAPLMQDFSYMAGNDAAGAAAFSTFLGELTALQVRLKAQQHESWKMYPADLEVSVSG
jgi:arachidonate 15-lipoxygenase